MIGDVPERYREASIEFSPRWNRETRAVCVDFLKKGEEYFKEGIAPTFLGTSGSGKTYAAASIVNYFIQMNPQFEYVWAPTGEMLDRIMATRDFRGEAYWKWDNRLKNAPLVVFDDFGHLTEFPRSREAFWIYVNRRYDSKLPTIFTANLADWEAVTKHFGEHISRRIKEMANGLAIAL